MKNTYEGRRGVYAFFEDRERDGVEREKDFRGVRGRLDQRVTILENREGGGCWGRVFP